jgi:ribonuclease D
VSQSLSPITRAEDLTPVAARLAEASRIAVDTEFMRERTYYAELALIQLADADGVALVDPLGDLDTAAVTDLLTRPGQCKVLHAARQDVEVLLPWTRLPIGPILDTQIAAALCGYGPQVGYGELVAKELNVVLEKGQARTDWKRRPLSAAQLSYAADDVRYLLALASQLEEKLAELGRSAWLAEDLAALADPALYRVDPADAWQRFKGIETLPAREQLRLRALAAWREERAIQRNLPRGWVLPDDIARTLARTAPRTVADLGQLDLMDASTLDKLGPAIIAALESAAEQSVDGIVQRLEGRPDPIERDRQKRFAEAAKQVATLIGIAPEVLATQRDLRRIVRGEAVDQVFSGWRLSLLAEPLARVSD